MIKKVNKETPGGKIQAMTISPQLKFKIEGYVVDDNSLPTQSYALKIKSHIPGSPK